MNRILILALALATNISFAVAQMPQQQSGRVRASENANYKSNRIKKAFSLNYNHDLNKYIPSNSLIKSRLGSNHHKYNSNLTPTIVSQSSTSSLSVPNELLGTFRCKGVSYFGGVITGETEITADKTNANKIWFSNLVPGGSNKNVYGIVSADQKSISIPQGQQIYSNLGDISTLVVYASTDDLVGQFDASSGTITFTTDLWGSMSSKSLWNELFTGNVTFTRLDKLPPEVSYRQPTGGLFLGLDPDTWNWYASSCIINSPYVTWNWQNTQIEDDVSYSWNYKDLVTEESFSSNVDSLLMDVQENYYITPTLTASKGELKNSFVLGADYQNKADTSYSVAGGDAQWVGFDGRCDYGCANLDNGFTLLTAGTNSYYFGTGASQFTDKDYESLLVYYEKPLSTLYFEGINVYLFVFDAPDNTPFTMNIIHAEKDTAGFSIKGEVIASSTILAKEVIPIIYDNQVFGYTMKFSGFEVKDADGFFVKKEEFELNDDFYLELSGFNVKGVSLAVCTEEINPTDGDSRSSFTFKDDNSIYYWNNTRQTMYFNLAGAAYSYITVDTNVIYDNRSGGIYDIDVVPFFDTLSISKEYLPDWVHVDIIDEEYSDLNWGATVKVTLDPLAANAEPRYSNFDLKTLGATKNIFINQGGKVSNGNIKKGKLAYAFKNQEGFSVNYPKDMKFMSVYSTYGSLIGRYKLPDAGTYQLYDFVLEKGLYILKLESDNYFETIKIIK